MYLDEEITKKTFKYLIEGGDRTSIFYIYQKFTNSEKTHQVDQ